MKRLGYYAKDKENNLFKFEWGAGDEFSILNSDGEYVMACPLDYVIVEAGYFTADDEEKKEINPYGIFLMVELARGHNIIDPELEYDLTWEKAQSLFSDYMKSEFNDEEKSEYDCINEYLIDYHNKNIVQEIYFPKHDIEVTFKNLEGEEVTLKARTDGEEEDFWMGFDLGNKAYEINAWFDEGDTPNVNVYQLTQKNEEGLWVMDGMQEFRDFDLVLTKVQE